MLGLIRHRFLIVFLFAKGLPKARPDLAPSGRHLGGISEAPQGYVTQNDPKGNLGSSDRFSYVFVPFFERFFHSPGAPRGGAHSPRGVCLGGLLVTSSEATKLTQILRPFFRRFFCQGVG